MAVAVSSVEGRACPKSLSSGVAGRMFAYRRSDYLQPPESVAGVPQAFLVEFDEPGAVVAPHFHRVDQFQIVVAGSSTFGKHAVVPLTAHFADAYTPYGPITVGPEGLAFFTLRPARDTGALWMPGARAELRRKARRNLSAHVACATPAALAAAGAGALVTVLAHADGLEVAVATAGPGARLASPAPAGTGGQFQLVAEGAVEHAGRCWPRWSCFWTGPDETAPALAAGPEGAQTMIVRFPRPSARQPRGPEPPA